MAEVTWQVLLRQSTFRSFRFGPSTVAVSAICLLALCFFSIADYREIAYQRREQSLNELDAKTETERAAFAQWLQEKEKDFDRYLMVTGEATLDGAVESESSIAAAGYSHIKERIERVENRIRILSEFQERDEEYFWYVPSISPVALQDDFTIATGPLTVANTKGKLSGVSSKHGLRVHPLDGRVQMHYGIDIFCPLGTPVRAPANGRISFVGKYSVNEDNLRHSFGNFVEVEHGDTGITTLYAHLGQVDVIQGQIVKRGEQIALSGNTGSSTGPHVHYEVIRGGTKVNPLNYITDVQLVDRGKRVLYLKKSLKPVKTASARKR